MEENTAKNTIVVCCTIVCHTTIVFLLPPMLTWKLGSQAATTRANHQRFNLSCFALVVLYITILLPSTTYCQGVSLITVSQFTLTWYQRVNQTGKVYARSATAERAFSILYFLLSTFRLEDSAALFLPDFHISLPQNYRHTNVSTENTELEFRMKHHPAWFRSARHEPDTNTF
jgi:hypothetical protein